MRGIQQELVQRNLGAVEVILEPRRVTFLGEPRHALSDVLPVLQLRGGELWKEVVHVNERSPRVRPPRRARVAASRAAHGCAAPGCAVAEQPGRRRVEMVPPPRAPVGDEPRASRIVRTPGRVPVPGARGYQTPAVPLRAIRSEEPFVAFTSPVLALPRAGAVVEAELLDDRLTPDADVPVEAPALHRGVDPGLSGLPRAPVRARTRVVSRPPKVVRFSTRRSIPVEFCVPRPLRRDALVVASLHGPFREFAHRGVRRGVRPGVRGAVGGDVVGELPIGMRVSQISRVEVRDAPAASTLGGGEVALPRAPRLVLDPDELAGRRRVLVASRGCERLAARTVQRERASARAQLAVARAPAASALVARDPRRVGNHHDSGTRRRRRRGRRRRTRVARAADVAPCPGIISQSRRSAPERRAHRVGPLDVPVDVHRRPRFDDHGRGCRPG